MTMFLIYAAKPQFRAGTQINAALVDAASAAAARTAAVAAAPYGDVVKVIPHWDAIEIVDGSQIGDGTKSVVWFQGRGPVSLLGLDSGGNPID